MRDTATPSIAPLGRAEIELLLPIAPGWILVERVVECRPPDYIRTCRRIEAGDAFVAAHVPGGAQVLRESLLIEFAQQSAYLLVLLSRTGPDDVWQPRPPTRCSAQFLAPACVGELLVAEVMLDDSVDGVMLHDATLTCGERIVCRTRMFAAPDPTAKRRMKTAGPSSSTWEGGARRRGIAGVD
ncbi:MULTISPECIES: hypothetical protein [Massilia]|uniref:Uncharacterized protein n=1 Tax=Massilia aurea TaxID=373040 RepID=A0A422QIC8_9BURK|nr:MULTISPECIES: hypothetical protein [Massilia]MDY0964978.1 hypothetical protein [Massilia sp. CFBP9026]RNF29693.1 hypothetical protein NM04_16690 [Massilia aurea]